MYRFVTILCLFIENFFTTAPQKLLLCSNACVEATSCLHHWSGKLRKNPIKYNRIPHIPSHPPFHPPCLPACLPRLIFSHIRRLGSFVLVQNFEFHFFGRFQKNKYFLGYEDFVDIFFGYSKNWTILSGLSINFMVFS